LARLYGEGFGDLGIQNHKDLVLYRGKGCQKCNHTGYLGRTAIFELLRGTEEIKRLIQKRAPIDDLRFQAAERDGMTTLMQDGIRKVCQGVADVHEIRKVCIK
jgi:type II secretory ATPase GspE/PulE/Tfp pilus assembly ATPase PilB-like protein